MRSRYIFDAGVLFLYFAGNSKVRGYFEEVNRGESEGFVSEVTLAEFYYKTAEEFGLEMAKIRYDSIRNSRVKQLPPKGNVTENAAILKIRTRNRLALADCFLMSEGESLGAKILTTDSGIKEIGGDRVRCFEVSLN
ncbi:MAG: type II toxin-antitoxin system VapC family toxin [Candidatus Verstraetearchaeota archaeon]|nr:type II toxin-antitoxin system VapC family toxin [Candidatus Verstraetearchaeota archaeon]